MSLLSLLLPIQKIWTKHSCNSIDDQFSKKLKFLENLIYKVSIAGQILFILHTADINNYLAIDPSASPITIIKRRGGSRR